MALVRQSDDQVERFKTYVRSLNEQFARWIVQQWETKSDKFWSHGMVDYLRHAVIIKRDHPDAAAMLGLSLTAIPDPVCGLCEQVNSMHSPQSFRIYCLHCHCSSKNLLQTQSQMGSRSGSMRRSSQFSQCSTRRSAAALHKTPYNIPCNMQIGSPAFCPGSLAPCQAHWMTQVRASHRRHPQL